MMKIDLLPPWAQDAKLRRKRIIIMVITQIAVFLLLGISLAYINMRVRQTYDYAHALTEKLNALEQTPSEIAQQLQSARIIEIHEYILPAVFKSEWLDFILDSTPENTFISRIDYNMQEISLNASTADLNNIQAHLTNLRSHFENVTQGNITRVDGGYYSYEIQINIID